MDEIDQAELEAAAEMDAYAQAIEEADDVELGAVAGSGEPTKAGQ